MHGREVLLLDRGTSVEGGFRKAGLRRGFILTTLSRQLVVKCGARRQAKVTFVFSAEILLHTNFFISLFQKILLLGLVS